MKENNFTPEQWFENFKQSLEEIREIQRENAKQIKENNNAISGIGHSNGAAAEEMIFNALEKDKIFGGIKFDFIDKHWKLKSK
jgi:predicted esterase